MDHALDSSVGNRENQEDYGLIRSYASGGGVLAIVSDGMGGQVGGEVASATVVSRFVDFFDSNNSRNLPLRLSLALDKANRALANHVAANPRLQGMGATLIAAYVDATGLSWISVGDSIVYLYRDKRLLRLNEDHSMAPILEESVRLGKIKQDEALSHPQRNALRSALTGDEIPIIDLREIPLTLRKKDVILLATDGLLSLSKSEVLSVLEEAKDKPAKVIADRLISAVAGKNRPRQDNTLVAVLKIQHGSRVTFRRPGILISATIFTIFAVTAGLILSNKGITPQEHNVKWGSTRTSAVVSEPKVVPIEIPGEAPPEVKNNNTTANNRIKPSGQQVKKEAPNSTSKDLKGPQKKSGASDEAKEEPPENRSDNKDIVLSRIVTVPPDTNSLDATKTQPQPSVKSTVEGSEAIQAPAAGR